MTYPEADFVDFKKFTVLLTCFLHQSSCRCTLLQSTQSPQLILLINEPTEYLEETENVCWRWTMMVKKTDYHFFSGFISGQYTTTKSNHKDISQTP